MKWRTIQEAFKKGAKANLADWPEKIYVMFNCRRYHIYHGNVYIGRYSMSVDDLASDQWELYQEDEQKMHPAPHIKDLYHHLFKGYAAGVYPFSNDRSTGKGFVRGNLVWENGPGSKVIWVDDVNGRMSMVSNECDQEKDCCNHKKKKVVYIAHQIAGDTQANLTDLARILGIINRRTTDIIPFCPYYGDCVALNDQIAQERRRGLDNDLYLLKLGFIDELWLTGPEISKGMAEEAEIASKAGIFVIDFTNFF